MWSETDVLEFWKKQNIFQKTLDKPSPGGNYIFYDGPPFATGLPHYGHILGSAIKDAIPRYQTMQGKHVERKWGWDCHGLPIENIVEKDLGLSGKKEIEQFGIEKFNNHARGKVLGYINEWEKTIDRIGRWVDFKDSYKTMDTSYIESVWWALKELWNKDRIYETVRVLPYCPRCETPIANSEIAMDNSYKDISDISVYVKMELVNSPFENTYLLAWTTTPWTLPGNTAIAINTDIPYTKVSIDNEHFILAKDRVEAVLSGQEYTIESDINGKDLVGLNYKPVFSYFKDVDMPDKENIWKVWHADFVTADMGTGIAHEAPAFGEDDMVLAKQHNIPYIRHVEPNGTFSKEVTDFVGMKVKEKDNHQAADIEIIKYLAKNSTLFKKEKIVHSYPHCYRCDTPILYYALPSWFLKIEDTKKQMLALNEKLNWIPKHLQHGRFKHTVETAPDWNISRSRYWASPLPFWRCENNKNHIVIIGSTAELKEKATNFEDIFSDGVAHDLHREFVDRIIIACPECNGEMKRINEVIDCWFESGSMPFAQKHYPYENEAWFTKNFPGDFVAEYVAQTRTWFYYCHVVATQLFDTYAYENIVTTGTVLAEDGQKMSKSKGNFPDPWILFNKYGVDALRYYLLSSQLMRGEDLNFSERSVDEIYKKVILRLQNIYSFYELYSKGQSGSDSKSGDVLDQWIISRLHELIKTVTTALDSYAIDQAVKPIGEFIDDLSNWYLRRSRERLKANDQAAIKTFAYILEELAKVMAPIMPFIAESTFQGLDGERRESVHLEDWPKFDESKINNELNNQMSILRLLVSQIHEQRVKAGIKVRQPLAGVMLPDDARSIPQDLLDLLKDEVNVLNVTVVDQQKDVLLDTTLTDELKREGEIRDIIRLVQDARKKAGYSFTKEVSASIEGVSLSGEEKQRIQKETITLWREALTKVDAEATMQAITVRVGQ